MRLIPGAPATIAARRRSLLAPLRQQPAAVAHTLEGRAAEALVGHRDDPVDADQHAAVLHDLAFHFTELVRPQALLVLQDVVDVRVLETLEPPPVQPGVAQ